ncbi:MAG: T9SS type A sorting domain-containing protein, partial [FCB group bacterium]|nr:T9SS type A sorting domain-containing protein [FCB group bacterium]
YVGQYPWVIDDWDSFTFFKEGNDGGYIGSIDDWICSGESFDGEFTAVDVPEKTALHSPYPNPFNPSTVISFDLQEAGEVSLIVYDVQGREIQSLVNGHLSLGYHEVVFDGTDLASGMYFVRLTVDGGQSAVKKAVLMK